MDKKQSRYPVFAALLALLLAPLSSLAHPGMQHVMGVVASVTSTSVTVDTVRHTKITVLIDRSTKFVNGSTESSLKELKVGERVVIHAKENAADQLTGAEVKWGAESTTGKMEGMESKH